MELTLKKNYLTIEEIGNIVNQCAEKHTSYECELIKTVLVAKYCFDYDFRDKDDVTVYNELAEKIFLIMVILLLQISRFLRIVLEKKIALSRLLENFLKVLISQLKRYEKIPKNFDTKEFIKKVEEVVGRKENNK